MGKLEEVHSVWVVLPAKDRRKHPLPPLVAAWQERPRGVTPDVMQHPHGGILPAALAGAAVRVQVSDRFDEELPELPGPGVAADGDGWLPEFDPGPGRADLSRRPRSAGRPQKPPSCAVRSRGMPGPRRALRGILAPDMETLRTGGGKA